MFNLTFTRFCAERCLPIFADQFRGIKRSTRFQTAALGESCNQQHWIGLNEWECKQADISDHKNAGGKF